AAIARCKTRTQLVEQLDDHVAVAQAVEGQTTIGHRRLLAESDQRLDDATQLLRLGKGRLDDLVLEQRIGHIAEHRLTMAAGPIQLAKTVAVTHFSLPHSTRINRAFQARPAASFQVSCQASGHVWPTLP